MLISSSSLSLRRTMSNKGEFFTARNPPRSGNCDVDGGIKRAIHPSRGGDEVDRRVAQFNCVSDEKLISFRFLTANIFKESHEWLMRLQTVDVFPPVRFDAKVSPRSVTLALLTFCPSRQEIVANYDSLCLGQRDARREGQSQ
jgi:hypothetical protein